MTTLTAAELGAFLGVPASTVRQIVHRAQIKPVGKQGKANVYHVEQVLRHAGTHDRRATCRSDMSH